VTITVASQLQCLADCARPAFTSLHTSLLLLLCDMHSLKARTYSFTRSPPCALRAATHRHSRRVMPHTKGSAAAAHSNGTASTSPMKHAFLIYNPVAGQVSICNLGAGRSEQAPACTVQQPASCPVFTKQQCRSLPPPYTCVQSSYLHISMH
jgi:hypothetical protein